MLFTHKLAKRLALLKGAALVGLGALAGCGEEPTSPLTGLDQPVSALSPNDAPPGTRVRTTRWVQVFSSPTSNSFVKQRIRATGTIVSGPAGDQRRLRWDVNFDEGPDGWIIGAYLEKIAPAPVTAITVTPATASVAVGATAQLSAAVRDASGNPATATVTWSSTNPAIATVSGSGLVRGMGAGSAAVIATSGTIADTAAITVTGGSVAPVASVTLAPATAALAVGGTAQLTATLRDANGNVLTGRSINWTTSNAGVAGVTSAGQVQALGAGSATITATSEGRSGTAAITVTAATAAVASVTVTPSPASVVTGGSLQLTATLRDAAGNVLSGRTVTWSSSNPTVAAVLPGGLVTGGIAGGATITATSEGRSGTASVTVTLPGSGGVLFSSDWGTGTGTSEDVLFDRQGATPWNMRIGNGRLNAVVSSSGLDFPTPNVLRVTAGYRSGGGAAAENIRLNDGLPLLNIGQSRYYRWYIRVVIPDSYTSDDQTHPIQDGTNGSVTNWMFQVFAERGSWNLSWHSGGAWPNNRFICRTPLPKGRTYRVEMRMTRTGSSTMTMAARAYDTQGNLVCGETDFLNVDGSRTMASLPSLSIANPDWFRGFQVGFNGLNTGTESEFPMVLYYQGAVCIRSDTWCGAYTGSH
jgi:uncharacterized protein YjdB